MWDVFSEDAKEENKKHDETEPICDKGRKGNSERFKYNGKEIAIPRGTSDSRTKPHGNEVSIHEDGIEIDHEEQCELKPKCLIGEERRTSQCDIYHSQENGEGQEYHA